MRKRQFLGGVVVLALGLSWITITGPAASAHINSNPILSSNGVDADNGKKDIGDAPTVYQTGQPLQFQANISSLAAGTQMRWQWTSDSSDTTDGASATKSFGEPGIYIVKLLTKNGSSWQTYHQVRVQIVPATAKPWYDYAVPVSLAIAGIFFIGMVVALLRRILQG
jgi:hypothetical protein